MVPEDIETVATLLAASLFIVIFVKMALPPK
jgi:hypothetical protein